jgi:transcriptional regulator with XRE-family HTH domain
MRAAVIPGMRIDREMSIAFGKVIKKRREMQGISLARLAEMAGTAQTHPGKMEKNVVSPNLDVASAYAKALGLPLSKLIAEAEKLRKQS